MSVINEICQFSGLSLKHIYTFQENTQTNLTMGIVLLCSSFLPFVITQVSVDRVNRSINQMKRVQFIINHKSIITRTPSIETVFSHSWKTLVLWKEWNMILSYRIIIYYFQIDSYIDLIKVDLIKLTDVVYLLTSRHKVKDRLFFIEWIR